MWHMMIRDIFGQTWQENKWATTTHTSSIQVAISSVGNLIWNWSLLSPQWKFGCSLPNDKTLIHERFLGCLRDTWKKVHLTSHVKHQKTCLYLSILVDKSFSVLHEHNFRRSRVVDWRGTLRGFMLAVFRSLRNSSKLIFPSLSMSTSSNSGSMEPFRPVCCSYRNIVRF